MRGKKLLSALLTAAMVLGTAVFSVGAAEPQETSIAPINRGNNEVSDNGDGTYTVKAADTVKQSSFYLPTKNFTFDANATDEKYVKISVDIETVTAGTSNEINPRYRNSEGGNQEPRNVYTATKLSGNQKLDMIVDLSTYTIDYYVDAVHKFSYTNTDYPTFSGVTIFANMTEGTPTKYILSNPTYTAYSSEYTLDDVMLDIYPEKTTVSLTPQVRGGATVEDNENGTYTYKGNTGLKESSFVIKTSKTYSVSPDALAEKYVRISANIQTINAATSANEHMLIPDNDGNKIRSANGTKLTGNQKLDVVVDLSTGTTYFYVDNTSKGENTGLSSHSVFTGYANIAKNSNETDTPAEYVFSNVTETVYSAANTLDEIVFDMIDDVMLEETSQKNNGVPGGLTNWSTENAYDSATDTITVTESVPLVGKIGRFTPLAASIKLGDQSGYAGLYHFTTYWTTTTQDEPTDKEDGAYYIINIGSGSVYNTQNVSVSVGNKYSSSPVVTGREYRVDVIIDANDPAAPKSYIYRDGILHKEAELAGTDLMGQSVYASIRILDTADYEGKFRGTKATVYKKGVKTAEQIKTQIIDEISDSDIPVTIASPSISYADGKLVVKTEFVGAHADKTKYVAGYNSKNELVFVLSPEAAAAGITLDKTAVSKVKVFAWDNFEPVAYMVDAKVEIED